MAIYDKEREDRVMIPKWEYRALRDTATRVDVVLAEMEADRYMTIEEAEAENHQEYARSHAEGCWRSHRDRYTRREHRSGRQRGRDTAWSAVQLRYVCTESWTLHLWHVDARRG